ncbi:uncharacterized protein LOC110269220 [Arachis ipaensis]|uniref:uncharacterized protein LOC110269220 n=1 Tax=Arachis ipaensis TaxID=130454 RepID=UPI000A2B058A|nr:uncharacterized protein LOC110269220 [Arachis ipaensis]
MHAVSTSSHRRPSQHLHRSHSPSEVRGASLEIRTALSVEVSRGNRSHRHHSLPSGSVVLSDLKPLPLSQAPFLIPQSHTYSHYFSPKHNPSLHRAPVGRTVTAWFIVIVLQSSYFMVLEGPSIPPTPILLLIDDKLILLCRIL